jgi:hypothetical protein
MGVDVAGLKGEELWEGDGKLKWKWKKLMSTVRPASEYLPHKSLER